MRVIKNKIDVATVSAIEQESYQVSTVLNWKKSESLLSRLPDSLALVSKW